MGEVGIVIFIIYSVWAIYSGYRFINGRYEWLEGTEILNRTCKVGAILGAGYVIGAFYFCKLILTVALRITDGFR